MPEAERSTYLDKECGTDRELRKHVARLMGQFRRVALLGHQARQRAQAQLGEIMRDMRLFAGQLHAVCAQVLERVPCRHARSVTLQPVIASLFGGTDHRRTRPQGVVKVEADQADVVEHGRRADQPGRSVVATGGGLRPLTHLCARCRSSIPGGIRIQWERINNSLSASAAELVSGRCGANRRSMSHPIR